MSARKKEKYSFADIPIVALSGYIGAFLLYVSFTGLIWVISSTQTIALWITLLVATLLATASMIFTHTLVYYSQQKKVRSLLILYLSVDIILMAILFLLSHASFELYSIFADTQRNRTLIVAFGLAVSSFAMGSAFYGEKIASLRNTIIPSIWSFLILPLVSLWFLLSPEPVFQLTGPTGLFALNPLGWFFVLSIALMIILSLLRYLHQWIRTKDSVSLSFILALLFWIFSVGIVAALDSPFQLGEVVWFGSFTAGFVLIAIAMFATAIIEPRKVLEDTVVLRTQELSVSKKESEFYLGMWTHKMGNLLQGLLVYLDLLSEAEESGSSPRDHRLSAMEIAREATLLNTQVTKLSQVNETEGLDRTPVSLAIAVSSAMDMASNLLNPDTFRVNFRTATDVTVLADEMLDVAILSILSFFVRTRLHEDLNITIWYKKDDDLVRVFIECVGNEMPMEIQEFLEEHAVPQTHTIELDIYVARTIIELFSGTIRYERLDKERINRLILTLDAAL
ncbi:MAG: hypothetical protein KAR33_04290 [Candidatus Thorarchaeota archaeon]|nr:hypothetical protein [Candidatus Thorarchaeota archaeon]